MRRLNCSCLLLCTFIVLLTLTIAVLFRKRLDPLRIYSENICDSQNTLDRSCDESTVWLTLEDLMVGPLAQNDSRIIDYIHRKDYLQQPSKLPYNLSSPDEDPSMGQSTIIKNALKHMRNGFFVECGALDGETRSNTLMLEKEYGWTGLLIEADPKNYAKLLKKNRKAWSTPSCLAIKDVPHQVMFEQRSNLGKISNKPIVEGGKPHVGYIRVQCFPLYSLLSAMNVSKVDYFSLDTEGTELDILHTIPFDTIYFKAISVEYVHDQGGREAVRKFMKSKHFRIIGEVKDPNNLANDLIFLNDRIK